ncbi:hypothetical protein ACRAWF_03330 [Streptomyces sp. L7]
MQRLLDDLLNGVRDGHGPAWAEGREQVVRLPGGAVRDVPAPGAALLVRVGRTARRPTAQGQLPADEHLMGRELFDGQPRFTLGNVRGLQPHPDRSTAARAQRPGQGGT